MHVVNRPAENVRRAALLLSISLTVVFWKVNAGNDTLLVPDNVNCACPDEVLTYTCNINGGGTTLWGGNAFDCSSTQNEIRLRHSQFASPGTSGTCNNNAMRAMSIGVVNTDCYISELSVTVRTAFDNRIIRCNHDSGTGERTIGSSTLNIASAPDSPSGLQFVDILEGQFMLSWTPPLSTTCVPTIYYRVTSNCSTCSSSTSSTNMTTDSCSLPQQWSGSLVCAFNVQSVACSGNLMGGLSNLAVVTLQEPSVTIVPRYSGNTLIKFIVLGTNLRIARSDNVNRFITTYNVTFFDPDTDNKIYSRLFSFCGEDTCEVDITPSSLIQVCPSSTITVTADYGLGQRPLSDPITIECINQFVDVQYNSTDSTISCTFLNQMDTSIKSCRVTYGPCDQEQTQNAEGLSSPAFPNNITLSIMPRGSYCYSVTASSDSFTIAVEGMIRSESGGTNLVAIVGGVVGGSVAIIGFVVASVIVIVIVMINRSSRKGNLVDVIGVEVKLKLKPLEGRSFVKIDIEKDCTLREAIERHQKNLFFKRGRAYYEFVHEKENVSENKELILINKKTGRCFFPNVALSILYENGLLGEGVQRPEYDDYQLFVQSTGSGARHLPAGSVLLYDKTKEWNPDKAPLQQVTSNHFMTTVISKECTVVEFQTQNDLRQKGSNVFIEYGDQVIKDIRDVMLKHKKTRKLFTGPTARSSPSSYLEQYRVFVLPREVEKIKLEPGTTVLHQNPKSRENLQFHVLEVDENNVQMAKFVEKKLDKVKFENGKAYYEFTEKEDFLFFKDVVLMPKKQNEMDLEFISSMRRFYWLSSSVPGVGITPQSMFSKDYRVFVQSTSQGSRCLKSNTILLYKI